MLTLDTIRAAQERIAPYIYETPLLRIPQLDEALGCQVYVKCENMQKTNAFKLRGAMNRMLTMPEADRAKGVITASSGNHGKALAYAARLLGTTACVVIPNTAPVVKVEGIRDCGAEVVFSEPAKRFEVADAIAQERGLTFVHPFDDYELMAGQGTAGLEIVSQLPEVDAVVVPIGGGGLIGGVSTAVKGLKPSAKVYGVEPTNVCRYTKSFAAGERVTLPGDSHSVADGTQTLCPGARNYPIVQSNVDAIATADEREILRATKLLLTKGKVLAEITSCQTLAAAQSRKLPIGKDDKVVFLLSGGNIAMDQFEKFKEAE